MLKLLRKHKWINILLVAVVLCAMFMFSAQDSVTSSELSGWFVKLFGNRFSDHFIRKSAHFLEFTALGFLIANLFESRWKMLFTLPAGFLVAAADEYHQLFSDGRGAMFQDVLLDFGGVCFGFLLIFILTCIQRNA